MTADVFLVGNECEDVVQPYCWDTPTEWNGTACYGAPHPSEPRVDRFTGAALKVDDCFLFDGSCAATGTIGASCMKNYNDTANLLKTANGTVVGEGHCCWNPTGVHDHVKQVTRLKCGSEMQRLKIDDIARVVVPVSIEGAPPVAIGTHVLTDKAGLDRQRTNATFVLHRPVKDPKNPILREDKPWEDRMHMFGSVVQVSADEWRIYYLVDGRFGLHNCVAVSRDGGASWVKPSLGLVPWGAIANLSDSTANNILGSDHNITNEGKDWLGWIGLNEGDADPSRRFVATMGPPSWFKTLPAACTPFGPARRDAAFLAFSADGLTFRMPSSAECYLSSKDDSQVRGAPCCSRPCAASRCRQIDIVYL